MSESESAAGSMSALVSAVLAELRATGDGFGAIARVCQTCVDLLPVDGASISVMLGTRHRRGLYATDAVIERVEALQFSLGEGPCYEAFETGRPVLVPDLARDAGLAWPVFAAQIQVKAGTQVGAGIEAGRIGAIFAFPLRRGAARLGAMDLYRDSPGWLSDEEVAMALQITDIATSALLAASAAGPRGEISEEWILGLMGNPAVVHQATGMVIAELRISADQALARLRGYAFATGRLLEDVSADLVTGRLHPAVVGG